VKVVILAGGMGTRLAEETEVRPKPMVEIGGRPILWHIMKHYAHHGFGEFHIALGYKGEYIKRYFLEYRELMSDLTVHLAAGRVETRSACAEDWTVHLNDTGLETLTGGRLRRIEKFLRAGPFMMTYGDGVSDVDLRALLAFHERHGKLATLTAVRPPARFGGVEFAAGDRVARFAEKPHIGEGWINGGYMVLEPKVLDYIGADDTSLEIGVLDRLALEGQLVGYRHEGFWQCMDTLRDARLLQSMWRDGQARWRVWS
jgi:glucose-1-phosphate cytidylyltransferase